MTGDVTFLPWLRRGLVRAIGAPDPLAGVLPKSASVKAWVEVEGRPSLPQTIELYGPETVIGLSDAEVLRTEPRAGTPDAEPGYFPFVELATPDLPWLLTPAQPDGQGRLRPWLVLVCVREQEGITLEPEPDVPLPVLRIADPASPSVELPDLVDSWAWAHVQSLVPVEDIESSLASAPGDVIARVVCPRHLVPGEAWLACLVPAFDVGVAAGLGRPLPDGDEIDLAWKRAGLGPTIELPVYYSWRFSTGPGGTFESLCRRLKPAGEGAELGLHAMDVSEPGLVSAAGRRVLLDMEGALRTLEAKPRKWDTTHRGEFQAALELVLDAAVARATPKIRRGAYDPAVDDPVVGPPLYGAWPAGSTSVPDAGWVRSLNLHPVRRAAAGLGARVVRANQEELV
ncbi:MAG: hypothetical protein L0206_20925, partial [Actinobacteria bacterium]|nr:hypothetical protein [Actinomycetota bacterium]